MIYQESATLMDIASTGTSDNPQLLATQACTACRRQKRKCDKALPACGLCLRIGRACDYAAPGSETESSQPTLEEFDALRRKVQDLESLVATTSSPSHGSTSSGGRLSSDREINAKSRAREGPASITWSDRHASPRSVSSSQWSTSNDLPALFFMDLKQFRHGGYQVGTPMFVHLPPFAMALMEDVQELRLSMEDYFSQIHPTFPIVSKMRLYQRLADALHEPRADLALLCVAAKLITTDVTGQSPQTVLYQEAKRLYALVESEYSHSIALIQALLLIGLYELAHAIYPAAYLTTGQAARLAYAMGLHDRKTASMLPRTVTWTEQEERRRVMWAVIILDRYGTVGIYDRPFASQDPSVEAILPTDDAAWDSGQMLAAAPLSLSANQNISVAPFARTCQASHILGKAIRHVGDEKLPLEYRFEEALQLEYTLRALLHSIDAEISQVSDAMAGLLFPSKALCLTGLLSLFDRYSCPNDLMENAPEVQLQVHKRSIDGTMEITNRVLEFGERVVKHADSYGASKISPLVIDALFQGLSNYSWYVHESYDAELLEKLQRMQAVVREVDKRWKAAGQAGRLAAGYLPTT